MNILFGDANFDFANVNLIVDGALDRQPDVLITLSAAVTRAAIQATSELDDPPGLLFGLVYDPYDAAIVDAPCIKPDHVTGAQMLTQYERIFPLLKVQNPELTTVGTMFSTNEVSGAYGARKIMQIAESEGVSVLLAGVKSIADIPLATDGLIEKGAEALLIPADLLTSSGMPAIVRAAQEASIPIFHSTFGAVGVGATIAAGVSEEFLQGRILGNVLVEFLEGSRDIATTPVINLESTLVAINMDTARAHDIEIAQQLLDLADTIIEDGVIRSLTVVRALEAAGLDEEQIAFVEEAVATFEAGYPLSAEQSAVITQLQTVLGQDDQDLTSDLHCTDAMIAEQMAELDAADG